MRPATPLSCLALALILGISLPAPAQFAPGIPSKKPESPEPPIEPVAPEDIPGPDEPAPKPKQNPDKKKPGPDKEEPAAPASPRAITPSDYGQWEQLDLGPKVLSDDGSWLVHTIRKNDDSKILYLHQLGAEEVSEAATFPQGERPEFSNDSQWLAVTIGKSPAEVRKARQGGAPPAPAAGNTIHLRRLADGETTEFKEVQSISFSEDSRFAAIEVRDKPSPAGRPGPSSGPAPAARSALIVRNLSDASDATFGNVVRHAWSGDGSLLAMVIDSPSISNALQLYDPQSGVLRTLETSDQEYVTLTWRNESCDLAVLREMAHGEKEEASHVLLAWRDLAGDDPSSFHYDHAGLASFPADLRIVPGLSWSKDGAAIFCDLQRWENKPADFPEPPEKKSRKKKGKKQAKQQPDPSPEAKPGDQPEAPQKPGNEAKQPAAPEMNGKAAPTDQPEPGKKKPEAKPKTLRETLTTPSNVEVWHSKDVDIMPRQKKQAGSERNPKRRAAWWPERNRFTQLANELTEDVRVVGTGRRALGLDHTPHERTAMFGPHLDDVYVIDTLSGKRTRILEGVKFALSTSPDGRYFLYVHEGDVWAYDLQRRKNRNLTAELDTHFTNQDDDTLAVEKRPFDGGTWLADSSAVILADEFDLWLVSPNGARATRLTHGAENEIRHRISRANFTDDERTLQPSAPLYLALYGERTKMSGYGRLDLGSKGRPSGEMETLLWEERQVANLVRAKDAPVFTLTKERTDESPNLFVGGPDLSDASQVTNTNPFQADFLWGRSELVDYENRDGVKLQGALTYPAGYEEGKQYPMIVYIYEKRSQDLHRYYPPSEKHPYNPTTFSSEGYFVFQPDIVYRPQEPGLSALDCVEPAVEAVLATGMVDPKRVGLMGHSWGAYQTSFIVTHSKLFAAGVAGAPLTDMMSMSVSVYWNSGQTNAVIFSQSQGRMNRPFWRDVENYVANSPIHGIDDLEAPLLIAFGDKDGAVDWDQGIQMYNAARWAGIDDLVMLVYPGENHGLRKEENMVDYHYRVREWFSHHLKGEEARKWIVEGKSFLEREQEKEDLKKK